MIMICQECGSPISIQSNFCGYCGSTLSSYEIWNNVTKEIVPKLENTYKIGVVQDQKTVSFVIKNTGAVVIGIHVEQDTHKSNTMSFLQIDDQKMLQQTITLVFMVLVLMVVLLEDLNYPQNKHVSHLDRNCRHLILDTQICIHMNHHQPNHLQHYHQS